MLNSCKKIDITPLDVCEVIHTGLRAIAKYDPPLGPHSPPAYWPDIIRSYYEGYNNASARDKLYRKGVASREQADAMIVATRLLMQIQDPVTRNIVMGRLMPWGRGGRLTPWRYIAKNTGYGVRTCQNRFRAAVVGLCYV